MTYVLNPGKTILQHQIHSFKLNCKYGNKWMLSSLRNVFTRRRGVNKQQANEEKTRNAKPKTIWIISLLLIINKQQRGKGKTHKNHYREVQKKNEGPEIPQSRRRSRATPSLGPTKGSRIAFCQPTSEGCSLSSQGKATASRTFSTRTCTPPAPGPIAGGCLCQSKRWC